MMNYNYVKIYDITVADAGAYLLRASSKGGTVESRCNVYVEGEHCVHSDWPDSPTFPALADTSKSTDKVARFVQKLPETYTINVPGEETLTLTCKTSGDGAQVHWFIDGVAVSPQHARARVRTFDDGTSTMTVEKADRADTGVYTVRVANVHGTSETCTCSVEMREIAPVIRDQECVFVDKPANQLTVEEGGLLQLTCEVSGHPVPIGWTHSLLLPPPLLFAVHWSKDTKDIVATDDEQITIYTKHNTHQLKIKNVSYYNIYLNHQNIAGIHY
jgi:hypothetical protein